MELRRLIAGALMAVSRSLLQIAALLLDERTDF